ncbi:RsmB/NOP family class I SAM-dependent RNA methyltransferase [Kiloniella majae]|uniref:RsmB/NOP family class I SAM-dependent RNA methyltransferase n=1 Tax=Kiloniella majae TaxID=1938558 RepID=UPI000A278FBF|nr:RsmB/NOP family class I SAM-dependent RNA methyltransferase [Kiloniella majae]
MRPSGRIQTSIELLTEVMDSSLPMDRVVNSYLRARRFIGSKDRKDISARVYGVIRSKCRLDWWTIKSGLGDGCRSLVLSYATLIEGLKASELDEICDGGDYSPRALSEFENEALATLQGQDLNHPDMPAAVQGELQDWLYALFEKQFGIEGAKTEAAGLQHQASLDLRANLLKGERDQAIALLSKDNVEGAVTEFSPWGIRVQGRTALGNCKAFRDGLVEVQDEGSQLIALLCGVTPGQSVLDLCAGAGGKSLALGALLQNDGELVAMDIDPRRLQRAEPRVEKAGIENIRYATLNKDNLKKMSAKDVGKGFDRVLIDAPCSGSGTWRRQPDARLRITSDKFANYKEMQTKVLEQGASCVKIGGRLIYATCSVLDEENTGQIDTFLAKHPNYVRVPASKIWGEQGMEPCTFIDETMKVSPAQHGLDGFFCAVLERQS